MAQVNWKVAVIGLTILAVLGAGGVLVYSKLNEDPDKLYAKGENLLAEAVSESEKLAQSGSYTEDEEAKVKAIYVEAQNNFGGAYNATNDDDFRIKILFELVDFHKIDNPIHPADWDKAFACWNKILTINPKNIEANKCILDYMIATADNIAETGSPVGTEIWKRIQESATQLLDVYEELGQKPETYVLIAKAESLLNITKAGQTTNPESSINDVMDQLQSLQKTDPANIDIYKFEAMADAVKAKIEEGKGFLNATQQSQDKQIEYFQQAVEANPGSSEAYINLLNAKVVAYQKDKKQIEKLEADFVSLTIQFPDDPKVYAALASYYSLDLNKIDQSIENMTKARQLDPDNIQRIINLANAYLRKGLYTGDKASFEEAVRFADEGLQHPFSQETTGPRESANKMNRFELLNLSAMNLYELAIISEEDTRKEYAGRLEITVHDIEQFYGTAENPSVMKWRGMLDVAKEEYEGGIKKLYDAYNQIRVTSTVSTDGKHINPELRYLPYVLARLYKNKNEIGLYKQFLEDALSNNISYLAPEAILDYSEILIRAQQYNDAINILNSYKETYPSNRRTYDLLVSAYIQSNEIEKARQLLSSIGPSSSKEAMLAEYALLNKQIMQLLIESNTDGNIVLAPDTRQQADKLNARRVEILDALLTSYPQDAPVPVDAIRYYYLTEQTDKVVELLDRYLEYLKPEDSTYDSTYIQVKILRAQADEPDPQKIPADRNGQIITSVLSEISDVKQRSQLFATYYNSIADYQKAFEYYEQAYQAAPDDEAIISEFFEASLKVSNLEQARKLADIAKSENIDGCDGLLFQSRIDMLNKEYEAAVTKLNQCHEIRPMAPLILVLRSQCNSALANHQQAVDDAKAALEMNFLDQQISKLYVLAVAGRNNANQPNTSLAEKQELEKALSNAIVLNPNDWQMRGMYSEFVADTRPDYALAMRQTTARAFPNLQTNLQLGNMALSMAVKDVSTDKRKVLLEIAADAYAKAYQFDPTNQAMLDAYSEYYRVTGQSEKAEALFNADESMLWKFHIRDGQYDRAKELLVKLHAGEPENSSYIIGLITVSQRLSDNQSLVKYSNELLALDSNVENLLFVTQTYLDSGLIKESEESLKVLNSEFPDENRTRLLEAWLLLSKGQPNESLKLVDEFLAVKEDSAQGWMVRGQINRLMGNLEESIRDLQKSKQISPLPQVQLELARTYAQQGNSTLAIGLLKDAIDEGQSAVQARLMLESLYKQEQRNTDLENLYVQTIQKYPDNPGWYLKAGQFALSIENYNMAQQLLLKSWELSQTSGGNSTALSSYLASLVDAEDYDQANKYASQYIDGQFAHVAYTYLGLVQLKLGNDQKGIEYYHAALNKAGQDDNVITGILAHMTAHAGSKAVVDWCKSTLASNPNSIPANLAMYHMYVSSSDYANALKYINRCLDITSDNAGKWSGFAIQKAILLTSAYMKTSNQQYLEQSIKMYEDILKLPNNSNNGDILNNLAYLLADNNERIDDAVEYGKRAHMSRPNDPSRMDTYAYALCKSGNYKTAEELLLSAIVLYEKSNIDVIWDVYEHLAMAQEGLEKYDEAIASYKRAIQVGSEKMSSASKERILAAITRLNNR